MGDGRCSLGRLECASLTQRLPWATASCGKWEVWPGVGRGSHGRPRSLFLLSAGGGLRWLGAGSRTPEDTAHPPSLEEKALAAAGGRGHSPLEPHKLEGRIDSFLLLGQELNGGGGGVGAGNSLEKGFWKTLQLKAPLLAPIGRTPGSPPSSARNSPDPCSHVCQGPHRADGETRSQPGPDPAKPSAQCPGKASSSLGFRCVSCKQGKVLMIG